MSVLKPDMKSIVEYQETFRVIDAIGATTFSACGYLFTTTPISALFAATPFIVKAVERLLILNMVESEKIRERKYFLISSITINLLISTIAAVAVLTFAGVAVTAYHLSLFVLANSLPGAIDTLFCLCHTFSDRDFTSNKTPPRTIDQLEAVFRKLLALTEETLKREKSRMSRIEAIKDAIQQYRSSTSETLRRQAAHHIREIARGLFSKEHAAGKGYTDTQKEELAKLYPDFLKLAVLL